MLKDLSERHGDAVAIITLNTDPTAKAEHLRSFNEANGYSWPTGTVNRDVMVNYKVISRASMVGVDKDGIIRFRKGYGTAKGGWLVEVFSTLSQP